MNLGTKINLMIAAVTVAVLAIAFGVIVGIEARSIKTQALADSATVGDLLKDDIERMFQEVYDEQQSLQAVVDKLSTVEGVKYIKVTGVDGYRTAASDRAEVGKRAVGQEADNVSRVVGDGKEVSVQSEDAQGFTLERYIPVRETERDTSAVIAVIEVEAAMRSKSAESVRDAERTLQTISASIEQNARLIIVTRSHHLETMQTITDEIKRFNFFHDFIVFDNKLNVLASTDREKNEFANDPEEYKQYREDVLFGKRREFSYERIHDGQDVLVRLSPIELNIGGKASTVGLFEIHVLSAAYLANIQALIVRMVLLGIAFMVVLIAVLAFILRREVVGPITEYSRVAQKVADGDLSQRIEHISRDEIGRFGEVFNAMVANLYELDRLKTDFITVAAHQLRTPLSSVNWALKLLIDSEVGPVNDDQRSMLARGYETNTKMIKLVNDLLDVTRIEHGKFVYHFAESDLMGVLTEIVGNVEVAAREHNVAVHLEQKGDLPPFVFDAEKLSIALQNLVDNAVKYTLPGGSVTIVVQKKGAYAEVQVRDTGVGIPRDELPKLFSKFFRATNAIHLQTEGSGLGLVITKSVVMRHGGQIWADSVEGKGTTFTVTVPMLAELIPKEDSGRVMGE